MFEGYRVRVRDTGSAQQRFAGRSCNPSVLLHTIWHIFARHGKLDIPVYVLQIVGLMLLLARFEFYETASQSFQIFIYGSIWLIVLTVSSICCWIYCNLLRYTWRKRQLLYDQSKKYGGIFVVSIVVSMLCLGLLSSYTLAPRVYERIDEMEFPVIWKVLFIITASLWTIEKVLSSFLVALVLPMTLLWANQLNSHQTDDLLELFPWKVFLFLHRIILLTTFFGKPWCHFDLFKYPWCFFEDGVHFISFLYRIVAIVWLFILVKYVGYKPAMLLQQETQDLASTSETHGRHEMVTGLSRSWLIPASTLEKSDIVTGTTLPFRKEQYTLPDSEFVSGCHFSLKRYVPHASAGASISET